MTGLNTKITVPVLAAAGFGSAMSAQSALADAAVVAAVRRAYHHEHKNEDLPPPIVIDLGTSAAPRLQDTQKQLIENGAFPEMNDGEPVYRSELVRQVFADYYERTLRFFVPRFQSSISTSFSLTNETKYPDSLSVIENKGGVYIGVGQSNPFTHAAVQNAAHAFVVDYDSSIPLVFTPLWGAMLCMAPTRTHFMSLASGFSLPLPETIATLESLPPEEFLKYYENADRSFNLNGFHGMFLSLMADFLPRGILRDAVHAEFDWQKMIFGKVPFKADNHPFKRLVLNDGKGRGGLLSSDAQYQRERRLFIEGRVTGVSADFADGGLGHVKKVVEKSGWNVGVIYMSNLEQYMHHSRSKYVSLLYYLLGTLDGALIISALNLTRTAVAPVKEYVARAIPAVEMRTSDGKSRGDYASDFYWLRHLIETAKEQNIRTESFLYENAKFHRQKEMTSHFGFTVEDAVMDAWKIFGEKKTSDRNFHSAMLQKSSTYKSWPEEVRTMFELNLKYAGAWILPG